MSRGPILVALTLLACGAPRENGRAPADAKCTAAGDAGLVPSTWAHGAPKGDAKSDADSAEPPVSPRARFFPGPDVADGEKRSRVKTAVLLFAAPNDRESEPPSDTSIVMVKRLSFEPVLCVLAGKLASGLKCAEAMPAQTTVRTTAGGTFDVQRRTSPFHDTAGQKIYPAPYAPSCCMYNTCLGKTIPYTPVDEGYGVLHSDRTVLAIWPKDAEIDLEAATPETFNVSKKTEWGGLSGAPMAAAREYIPIATTDIDGDKHREILVYERWANDYGLFVVPSEGKPALFRFSCGNI